MIFGLSSQYLISILPAGDAAPVTAVPESEPGDDGTDSAVSARLRRTQDERRPCR